MDDNDKKSRDIFKASRNSDSLDKLLSTIKTVSIGHEFREKFGLNSRVMDSLNSITSASSIAESYRKATEYDSNFAAVTSASSLVESFKKAAEYESAIATATSASCIAESFRKVAEYDSAIATATSASSIAESFRKLAGFDLELASGTKLSSMAESLRKVAGFDTALSTVTSATSLADYINNSIAPSVMDSIRHQPSLIEGLNTASNSFLLLKDMLKVADYGSLYNDREVLDVINEPIQEYKVESIVDSLSGVSDSKRFIDIFKNLNPNIQAIIIYMVLSFFESQVNNVISYHINMGLDHIYSNHALNSKEKVQQIKSVIWEVDKAQLSNFRFITGDNVRLREDSSTKSAVLDELVLGQVVEVHSKKKNWIEVSYQYEDGTYMNGWVFTRYTARFVK